MSHKIINILSDVCTLLWRALVDAANRLVSVGSGIAERVRVADVEVVLATPLTVVSGKAAGPTLVIQSTRLAYCGAVVVKHIGVEELARLIVSVGSWVFPVVIGLRRARVCAVRDAERARESLDSHIGIATVAVLWSVNGRLVQESWIRVASRCSDRVIDKTV